MMRILAMSDAHGNYIRIPAILERAGDVDLILIAGDITNFGPDEQALEMMGMFDKPTLAIPGNCDLQSICNILDESKAINIHERLWTMENVAFIGMGGSNPTPFKTPYEIEEEEIAATLDKLAAEGRQKGDYLVLLSHSPPYCTLDRIEAGNVGCKAVADMLGKVDLIVCGHIHEDKGVMEVEGTTVVNTGMASEGSAALIELDEKSGKLDIEMLQV
jgi:hypothetical protein